MALRKSIMSRLKWVGIFVCFFFVCAIVRMSWTMTVERDGWLNTAQRLEKKNRVVRPQRGNIYSDNGQLISATMPYYYVYMDTRVPALHEKEGKLYKENIDSLCVALSRKFGDMTAAGYRRAIDAAYFRGEGRLKVYPKRISYIDAMDVKQFPLFRLGKFKSGLMLEEYANRENLYGTLAARTVGDIYGSGQGGQYGLELRYDSVLSGLSGMERGIRAGRSWVYIPIEDPVDGADLHTTLDIDMQDICDAALRKKLEQIGAKMGCLVLMEVKTGKIKAMVNLERNTQGEYGEKWNMAVADMSEPGSTFKTISMMIAIDNGVCDTSDVVDINHGRWPFGSEVMTDHNWRSGGYDSLTISKIIAYSSNVGTSKIIDEYYRNDKEKFVQSILDTKFAEDFQIDIPGAAVPRIKQTSWNRTTLPWMSIGYNVQVPPIYTLNFYNAIANGGKLMRPYLVDRIEKNGSVIKQFKPQVVNSSICKSSTLSKVKGMLEDVVDYGTAKTIKSKEFSIAGKTGTAQLGYGRGGAVKHQVSFCGYFPADNPMYSCIVVVKEPQMAPAAAFMCGEVFRNVAEKIYAQQVACEIERLPRWSADSLHLANLPRVKSGNRLFTENAMNNLNVDFAKDRGDWASFERITGSSDIVESSRPVLNNLVPNVVGMGASDAVYLMERAGLIVTMYGRGRVSSQSINPGNNAVKGTAVSLILK